MLCAHFLQQRGVNYLLVEAGRVGCGVTKNTTAKITAQHGLIYHSLIKNAGREKAQMYMEANRQAVAEYRRLCGRIDCGFEEKSAYTYTLDNPRAIEAEAAAAVSLGMEARVVERLPLPFSTMGAVEFPRQGQFNPLRFLQALAKDLNIYEETMVTAIKDHTAITRRGSITANKIIVATHFPFINRYGGYFLKLYQHRSYVIALEGAPLPDGMFVDESREGLSFRSYQDMLLLGGGSHRTGKQGGGWQELRSFAKLHYPQARERFHWATQDCMSLDGIPYIGQYSRVTPDLYVASGFNKWGMTGAMVSARILTDMVTGHDNPHRAVFSPHRSILKPQLFVNAGESAVNLLAPTTRRCTHMGCGLKWNSQEHSWDCCCHGSRYEKNGRVIDNPAMKNAKIK